MFDLQSSQSPRKLKGLYLMEASSFDLIYGPDERRDIEQHVEIIAPLLTRQSIAENMAMLRDVEVIFSGWGAPLIDGRFLDSAPRLRAFFYGAGTVGYCITKAVWERGVYVTSANAANAVPVAEYTLANIILCLKHTWHLVQRTRQLKTFPDRNGAPGAYGRTVGLVSLGATGRAVLKMLRPFDLKIIAFDPFLSEAEAKTWASKKPTLTLYFDSPMSYQFTPRCFPKPGE